MRKSIENWYLKQTSNNKLNFDPAQFDIIKIFDNFLNKFSNNGFLTVFQKKPKHLGFYIYGTVGCGKSMLMQELFNHAPTNKKIRLHFHQFMHNIQQKLSKNKYDNPLEQIAYQLKQSYSLIFLDEMHVSDIATAMILKNLFTSLFKQKIYLITSSNYNPEELYPDGLMRERFIPAIKLIKNKLDIIELKTDKDYRLNNSKLNQLFFIKQPNYKDELLKIFNYVVANNGHKAEYIDNSLITIQSREIPFIKKGINIIWLDFNIICGAMRSQIDYIELSNIFDWFIIENIHPLKIDDKSTAKRFTMLIDVLYDNKKKLSLSSSCEIDDIYPNHDFTDEFTRCISRLYEMQTTDYTSLF